MEFQVREMIPEDKPKISEFLRERFGSDAVQCRPGRFEWQFDRYPGRAKINLCFHQDRLVGQSCVLPVTLNVRNDRLSAAFSMDTMVSPDYQRKGIGEKFYQRKRDLVQVGLSSGQTQSAANLYKKMGWSVLGSYYQFRLVRRFPKLQRPRILAKDMLSYLRYQGATKKYNKKPHIVISSECPPALLRQLDRGLENEIFIKVTPEYLKWRYGEHPFYQYHYIQVYDGPQELGTCVARWRKPGTCRLVDFYCRRQNFPGLLEGIAHSLGCYDIEGKLVGAPLKKFFEETGFTLADSNQTILGNSKHNGLVETLSRSDWLVFGGDSDNDR